MLSWSSFLPSAVCILQSICSANAFASISSTALCAIYFPPYLVVSRIYTFRQRFCSPFLVSTGGSSLPSSMSIVWWCGNKHVPPTFSLSSFSAVCILQSTRSANVFLEFFLTIGRGYLTKHMFRQDFLHLFLCQDFVPSTFDHIL